MTPPELLYQRSARLDLPHCRCGKLLAATDAAELRKVEEIHAMGRENGAGELLLVHAAEIARLEPRVGAVGGLLSPETGIRRSRAVRELPARSRGARRAPRARQRGRPPRAARGALAPRRGWQRDRGSLGSERRPPGGDALDGLDVRARGYDQHVCKGDYFRIAPRLASLARHLVYPVPVQAGLGIYITFDLGGKLLAGPDVEYVDTIR